MARNWHFHLLSSDYHTSLCNNLVRVFRLGKVLGVITVEFAETEALSLSVAARAMLLAYEQSGVMTEEAYTELVKAAEKLDQALWGPEHQGLTPV